MKNDIKTCTTQYLRSVFISLEQYHDYVFWIRNQDMSQQIYVSHTYRAIWQQESAILFDIPLIWFDYLELENKNYYMQQLQQRHVAKYCDPLKNQIFYQVQTQPENKHISDICFRLKGTDSEIYIAGISKNLKPELWYHQAGAPKEIFAEDQAIHKYFFYLLEKYFGLTLVVDEQIFTVDDLRQKIVKQENIFLTNRELECLYYLCAGNTA